MSVEVFCSLESPSLESVRFHSDCSADDIWVPSLSLEYSVCSSQKEIIFRSFCFLAKSWTENHLNSRDYSRSFYT
jgi:hypothetical protein